MDKHVKKALQALSKRFKDVQYSGRMQNGYLAFLADYKPSKAVVLFDEETEEYTMFIRVFDKGWVNFKKLTYK